jgi:hypothetical protein
MAFEFKVDSTLGAAFIGFAVSCFVFGVLTTQCLTYFRLFPRDKVIYKALVRYPSCSLSTSFDVRIILGFCRLVMRSSSVLGLGIDYGSRFIEVLDQICIGHFVYIYSISCVH